MEWIEAEGATKEEAQKNALEVLGVTDLDLVEVEEQKVVRKFMGMGGRTVIIRARIKGGDDDTPDPPEPEDMTKPAPVEYDEKVASEEDSPPVTEEVIERQRLPLAPIPEDIITMESLYRPWVSKGPGGVEIPKRGKGFGKRLYDPAPFEGNGEEDQSAAPEAPEEREPVQYEDVADSPVSEEIKNKGVAFVEQVIADMGLTGKVAGYKLSDRLIIQIESDAGGLLIGRRGETLDALQFLTDIIINRDTEQRVRVILDTENYRDRRKDRLVEVAMEAADEAARTGREAPLSPMNPAERRVVHTTLADDSRVETFSEGSGARRRVIVRPANYGKNRNRGGGQNKPGGNRGGRGGRGGNRGGGRDRR